MLPELCFVSGAWDARSKQTRLYLSTDAVNVAGNEDGAVADAEGLLDGVGQPSFSGSGAARQRVLGAPPSASPSPLAALSSAALRAAAATALQGAPLASGCLVELNALTLVYGTVGDPRALAVAASVLVAFSNASKARALLLPALVAAGVAQGGPPGQPPPWYAGDGEGALLLLVPGSVAVQLQSRPALAAASSSRRVFLATLAEWVVGLIAAGGAAGLCCIAGAGVWRQLRLRKSARTIAPAEVAGAEEAGQPAPAAPRRAAGAVAPEKVRAAATAVAWAVSESLAQDAAAPPPLQRPLQRQQAPPQPKLLPTQLAASPQPPRQQQQPLPSARPPPPAQRASPPRLPAAEDVAARALDASAQERIRARQRDRKALRANAAAEALKKEPYMRRLQLAQRSNLPFWSSPHAPPTKVKETKPGWQPIDAERERCLAAGQPWPPPPLVRTVVVLVDSTGMRTEVGQAPGGGSAAGAGVGAGAGAAGGSGQPLLSAVLNTMPFTTSYSAEDANEGMNLNGGPAAV